MNHLSALSTLLIVLAAAGCMFNERPQADAAAANDTLTASGPVEKPGASIDSLLDAHNSYLEEAHRPGSLRARKSTECTDTALVQWGPVELAEKQ